MKTVSVVNHKGGVGKTTVTVNLGAELARRGYKVLLIDMDSQGNLTKACGVKIEPDKSNRHTIAQALLKIAEDKEYDVLQYINPTTVDENLDIVPCCIDMAETKLTLNISMARELMLKKFIASIEAVLGDSYYDYVLIDNAPSIEIDFQNSLVASEEVLIVTEAGEFSTDGIESLLRQLVKIREYFNPSLKIKGVLINKVDQRTNLAKDMIELIRDTFGGINVFTAMIPGSVKVQESQIMQTSIKQYKPGSNAAKAFSSFTDEFVEE